MRRPRFRLAALLIVIAALAVAFAVATPVVRRLVGHPNGWVVRTITRPDGTVVRQRIRRHPDRDVVYEEVLGGPRPSRSP